MADRESCFIIMPITTPDAVIEKYRDGEDHFKHVLDCLFIPSVEKAGYRPIRPSAEGTDLIQAKIIDNLDGADMVLCDMSCLNPNVFFEFGIRTALNKPLCLVKDNLTVKIPFDTGILNHLPYRSSLEPWELEEDIEKLAQHIKTAVDTCKGVNPLWKYLGFRTEAAAYTGDSEIGDMMEFVSMRLDSIDRKIEDGLREKTTIEDDHERIWGLIHALKPDAASIDNMAVDPNSVEIEYRGKWMDDKKAELARVLLKGYGRTVTFHRKTKN
jgi:hypothetical protein